MTILYIFCIGGCEPTRDRRSLYCCCSLKRSLPSPSPDRCEGVPHFNRVQLKQKLWRLLLVGILLHHQLLDNPTQSLANFLQQQILSELLSTSQPLGWTVRSVRMTLSNRIQDHFARAAGRGIGACQRADLFLACNRHGSPGPCRREITGRGRATEILGCLALYHRRETTVFNTWYLWPAWWKQDIYIYML